MDYLNDYLINIWFIHWLINWLMDQLLAPPPCWPKSGCTPSELQDVNTSQRNFRISHVWAWTWPPKFEKISAELASQHRDILLPNFCKVYQILAVVFGFFGRLLGLSLGFLGLLVADIPPGCQNMPDLWNSFIWLYSLASWASPAHLRVEFAHLGTWDVI